MRTVLANAVSLGSGAKLSYDIDPSANNELWQDCTVLITVAYGATVPGGNQEIIKAAYPVDSDDATAHSDDAPTVPYSATASGDHLLHTYLGNVGSPWQISVENDTDAAATLTVVVQRLVETL